MGRAAGDYFQIAHILVFFEFTQDILVIIIQEPAPGVAETVIIHQRYFMKIRTEPVTVDLPFGKLDHPIEVSDITAAQQIISHHIAKGR